VPSAIEKAITVSFFIESLPPWLVAEFAAVSAGLAIGRRERHS
jgi:hypothetical protein